MSDLFVDLFHIARASALGFLAGVGLGYLLFAPSRKELRMGICSKFNWRDLILGSLFVTLGLYSLQLSAQQDRQRDCLLSYIASNSDTSTIRSGLVAVESEATRGVILGTLNAQTHDQVIAARKEYKRLLRRIDAGRSANPVQTFNEKSCE